jgi:hypothetical protein
MRPERTDGATRAFPERPHFGLHARFLPKAGYARPILTKSALKLNAAHGNLDVSDQGAIQEGANLKTALVVA